MPDNPIDTLEGGGERGCPDDADIVRRIRVCITEERAIAIFRHYRDLEAASTAALIAKQKKQSTALNRAASGYARAAKLSPERRSEIARNAAKARWAT